MQPFLEYAMDSSAPADEALSTPVIAELMEGQMERLVPPSPQSTSLAEAEIVLAGYRDCCEEAIRYLVHVEHMPETDPLVVGLRQHLWERQQALNYQRILQELFIQTSETIHQEETPDTAENKEVESTEMHVVSGDIDTGGNNDSGNASMLESMTDLDSSSCTETEQNSVSTGEVIICNSDSVVTSSDSANVSSSEDFTQPMLTLALLAQNNPAIASLTDELITLLESDETDSESVDNQEEMSFNEH